MLELSNFKRGFKNHHLFLNDVNIFTLAYTLNN